MIHAWTALAAAICVVATCWSAGALLLDACHAKLTRAEAAPLRFLTGAAAFHLAIFALMAAKIAYKPAFLLLGAVLIAAAARKSSKIPALATPKHWTRFLFYPIFAVYSVFYLANAWAPETSPDGATYHLEIIVRYLAAHGFRPLTHTMYSGLGQGIELVYAPAVAFGGFSAASLVHFAFLLALARAIYAYAARIGQPVAGSLAAVLVFLSPVVARDATTAYIDVATAAVVFAVFYFLELWDESRNPRLLVPLGLLAGYAYAAKFTAFVMVLYALAFVAWRARQFRPIAITAAWATLVVAPWMLKDWIYFHDPFAPFALEIFPSPYLHVLAVEQWAEYLRRYDLPSFRLLPRDVTLRGDYLQGIVGPAFLLTPLALFSRRWRILLPGLVMFAVYFGNIGTRFLIPCLPFFALGIALALATSIPTTPILITSATVGQVFNLRRIFNPPLRVQQNLPHISAVALALATAFLCWPTLIPHYANPYVWHLEQFPWRAALRLQPESQYLPQHITDYAILKMIDDKVPPGEPVLATGDVGGTVYSSHPIIDHFPSAEGNTLWDILNTGWAPATQPLRLLTFHFPEHSITRIRLVETAQAAKDLQWSVHELRFFDRRAELPRAPQWRLRAHPNPYEVQLAFDNSPATRWRTWQTAAPGMYLEVNFGSPHAVDEVHMETSVDPPWPFAFQVESYENGRWTALTDQFESSANQLRPNPRRAASYELLHRGIHYLLVRAHDFGAADYNDDPALWGFKAVAATGDATLFRILP